MKPIKFPEQTSVLAVDQPEYLPLPVHTTSDRQVMISCWSFSWWERAKVLFGRKLWLRQMTFGNKLQPQLPEIEYPFEKKDK